ncbi:MAG: hypothetical protein ACLQVN_26615 [Bryobacteraceae bacterium]
MEVQRVEALVASGAAPRIELDKARAALADAQDTAIVRQSVTRPDLTEKQAGELVAAANRLFDRRKLAFDEAEKLVQSGLAPKLSLDTYLHDLQFARDQYDLAEARARLARELARMAEAEAALATRLAESLPPSPEVVERFDGDGIFTGAIFQRANAAFEAEFGKPLPVSAMGQTEIHRELGFDHRGRVDVALYPDQPEGQWLIRYLTLHRIPFFAFRQALPGIATGAHIHLGTASPRLTTP